MTHLLAIDPGKSTGIILGHYDETHPWRREAYWQVSDGIDGFIHWYRHTWMPFVNQQYGDRGGFHVEVVAEKFVPLNMADFSHTLNSTYPLVIEGALITLGLMPADPKSTAWQRAGVMYFSGGANLAAKKKASRAFLESHSLLLTGKNVGQPNAHDAISATLHSFAAMRRQKHNPTLIHYRIEEK